MYRDGFTTLIVILILMVCSIDCRIYSNYISVHTFRRNNGWNFLDRMNFEPGNMEMKLKLSITAKEFKFGAEYKLEVVAIPATLWDREAENKCNVGNFNSEELAQKRLQETVLSAHLSAQNDYTVELNSLIALPDYVTYQFVIRDCDQTIVREGFGREAKINIDLDVKNNGNYNSATEQYYTWLLPLLMILELSLIVLLKRDKEEEGDNWIKWLLKISMWIGISSVVFKYTGYAIYAWVNGADYQFFDFMYLLLHSTSDSILIVLLILLAFGWTVTFKNARDFDLYVPLASMLGLINIIMSLLNKVTDGEHNKYHMFDTIPAYIMIFFRLLAFAIFAVGVVRSYVTLKADQKEVVKYFYRLALLGTIYLTFIPVGFVLVQSVEANYRKEVMYFGVELTRFALNVWLAVLCGWKKSAYRVIIDKSFMEKEGKYF